jgi:outer membrane protein assembly complex protein YaeT
MRVAALLAGIALVGTATTARADVNEYQGQTVVSLAVMVEGVGSPGRIDPGVDRAIQTRTGQPLLMREVRESLVHLLSLGRFEDVVVRAALASGGVALTYDMVPVHPMARVAFSGTEALSGVDDGDLRRTLVDRYGGRPPSGRAAEAARLVEDELKARGYLRAQVVHRIEVTHRPDRAVLWFDVSGGERVRIGEVRADGAPGALAIAGALGLATGRPFERDAIDARAAEHVADRRADGFYEARLTVAADLVNEDRVANLTLVVSDGPRVRLVFAGDPLPSDQRDELVPVAREGSTDEDLLEDASNNIEEYLHAQGYRDATAPHTRNEAGSELHLTFTVTRGRLYRVARVEISGNVAVPLADFAPLVRLKEQDPFSEETLDSDAGAIEELYRRLGFAAADVRAGADPLAATPAGSEVPVVVRVIVNEGPRTIVASVRVEGGEAVSGESLRASLGLQPGRPFFVTQLAIDRDAILLQYANRGFRSASVRFNPGLSADRSRADVVFTVHEGPELRVGHVLIGGNVRTSREIIEREIQLKPGDPLGLAAVNETQRRLAALGLFRRTQLAEVTHGGEFTRDLLVTVEEAPVTTVGYGGGLEVGLRFRQTSGEAAEERLELAPRAFFDIGRRNLFGRNRSINLFTRISLRPRDRLTSAEPQPEPSTDGSTPPGFSFMEYRVLGTYREPQVFGTSADAFLTGTLEQQERSSFNFARRAFNAEVGRRLSRTVSVSGNYQIQRTELFDERISPDDQLLVDRLFPQVRLSSFSGSVVRDTRDDPLNARGGAYLSANGQLAARAIGSEVGLAKSYLTAQIFRPAPRLPRVVVAASARLGVAIGFPLKDLPASERFFAGGDTTVRGFALDQLGTPETIDENGFPIGGNALVILNGELRVPVFGGLDAVGFLDTGNVFARTSDIELSRLRGAVGFGIRYRSPVGPIRVDLGFKINPQFLAPGVPERLTALHISLGQAF